MGELYHHGIKGQRWGVRRYQNEDGTYTDEGKAWRLKQQGRISKYSHGTNNFRSAKRELLRRNSRNMAIASAGTIATAAGIGAISAGPIGVIPGAAAGVFIATGLNAVNQFKAQKMIDEMQDYAESSKQYADQIISQTGQMQVSDIINKK